MITDIPTPNDFFEAGINLLNVSWQNLAELLLDLKFASHEDWYELTDESREYWAVSQNLLGASLTLILQGTEFLLKGMIAEISPYLILAGSVNDWPRKSHVQDRSFSDFKTIDAQDLVKVHDTVAPKRLDPEFDQFFQDLRRKRNAFVHSVERKEFLVPRDILLAILQSTYYLIGPHSWLALLRDFLIKGEPKAVIFPDAEEDYRIPWQIRHILLLLKPSESKKYLGINKKQRRYVCTVCRDLYSQFEEEDSYYTSILMPNTPSSQNLYCYVCGTQHNVLRMQCSDCKGNVMKVVEYKDRSSDAVCLTCGWENPIP
jgi:hypothetical protein